MPTYDLEQRSLKFAQNIIQLCRLIKPNIYNSEIIGQVIRSSGSVGANYIEANDALGKKDFIFRLRISRKEAKEAVFWLNLLKTSEKQIASEIDKLIDEAIQLRNILSSIISKSQQ